MKITFNNTAQPLPILPKIGNILEICLPTGELIYALVTCRHKTWLNLVRLSADPIVDGHVIQIGANDAWTSTGGIVDSIRRASAEYRILQAELTLSYKF